jgi:hypothetical protein
MIRAALALLLLGAVATARAERVAGGRHTRIETGEHGAIHVWRSPHFRAKTAAVVVYVHGFYTDVDQSWSRHKLARQFAASKRNALFIVPEAPVGPDEDVRWPRLGELLRTVEAEVGELPGGPLVAVGHSAGYKTLVGWLDYGPLDTVILLDALYGSEESFYEWLTELPGHGAHRLLLVASDTEKYAEPFAERVDAKTIPRLPRRWKDLRSAARSAKVLYVRPKIGHMEIVTGGRVIPVALGFY